MDRAILKALNEQEWGYKEEILKKLAKYFDKDAFNFFGALYPHKLEGVVFYLGHVINQSFFNFLTEISDCVIVPIPTSVDVGKANLSWGGISRLLDLWDDGKVLPMLTSNIYHILEFPCKKLFFIGCL